MKKISKGVLLASLIGLSTTAVVAPVGIYYQQQTAKHTENNDSATAVDYDLVASFLEQDTTPKSALQSVTINLSEPTTNVSNTTAETLASLTTAQKSLVKQSQDELLTFFKAHNYTTAEISDYLVTNVPGYADAYHKSDQLLNAPSATTNDTERVINKALRFALQGASSTATKDNLTELIKNLTISRDVFVGLSVAVGIAAAGLFIAVPFTLGATAVAASACAAVSAGLGAVASGLDLALIAYKTKWNALTAASAFYDTYTIGHSLYQIVKPIIEKVTKTVLSSSWAFPLAMIIFNATIATLLVLLDHFA